MLFIVWRKDYSFPLNNARFALKLSHFIKSHFIYVVCVKINVF